MDSEIYKGRKIFFPIVDISTIEGEEPCDKIKNSSIPDRVDNILQHRKLMMPKNCNNIPYNWLELEILDLIKHPLKLGKFELYDENSKQICICRFVKAYEKEHRLNGYFSKPISCNYHSKTFEMDRYPSIIEKEKCINSSIESQMDESFTLDKLKTPDTANAATVSIVGTTSSSPHPPAGPHVTSSKMDYTSVGIGDGGFGNASDPSVVSNDYSRTIADNKRTEEIPLRHSPAALMLTNDDLEDVEGNSGTDKSSDNSSGSDTDNDSGKNDNKG